MDRGAGLVREMAGQQGQRGSRRETLNFWDLLQFPGWSGWVSWARLLLRGSGKRGGAVGEVTTLWSASRDSCLPSKGSDVIAVHNNKTWQMAGVWAGPGWRAHILTCTHTHTPLMSYTALALGNSYSKYLYAMYAQHHSISSNGRLIWFHF